LSLFLLISCGKQNSDNALKVRIKDDPESLNPVTFRSKTTRQLLDLVYQSLFSITLPNGQLQPVLVEEIPEILVSDSGIYAHIKIRDDAKWSDQSAVTSEDVAFTIKLFYLPDGELNGIINRCKFIENFKIIDKKNITFKFKYNSPELIENFAEFYIYPESILDPQNLLYDIPFEKLKSGINNPELKQFADVISSLNFLENRESISGSHAYKVTEWLPGQRVVLEKKNNFWFENAEENFLKAAPSKITFLVIPNDFSAIIALENQQLDILDQVSPVNFQKLKRNEGLTRQFNFHSIGSYGFTFMGVNAQRGPLKEKSFRHALSMLVPYVDIINVALYENAERTIGFIPPHQKDYYNGATELTPFNPDSAMEIFKNKGFFLENGKLKKNDENVELELIYDKGVAEFETVALLLRDGFGQAGINLIIRPVDKNVLNENLGKMDYDLCLKSLFGGPTAFNYDYILHTDFIPPTGRNYTSFGTKRSDSLISAINYTESKEERKDLLWEFQTILYEECNIIPIYNENNNIVVSKRYIDIQLSTLKPGYNLASFKLKESDILPD